MNFLSVNVAIRSVQSPRPVLMRRDEIWNVKKAANYCDTTEKTIRRWCRKHGIGRQSGPRAPIEISRIALEMVLQGDWEALELLRSGKRTHPDVIIYFDHIGIPA